MKNDDERIEFFTKEANAKRSTAGEASIEKALDNANKSKKRSETEYNNYIELASKKGGKHKKSIRRHRRKSTRRHRRSRTTRRHRRK